MEQGSISVFLFNRTFPSLIFPNTSVPEVSVHGISGRVVLYFFPMIPRIAKDLPECWMKISGAAGCAAQTCQFRDQYAQFQHFSVKIFGISTQTAREQKEVKRRLNLSFELISDEMLVLKRELNLPTFFAEGKEYYQRLTLVLWCGVIRHIFYPVPIPEDNAAGVIEYIQLEGQE